MVDFSKRIGKKKATRELDPVRLYAGLDRTSDKGPLRPAQARVLDHWHRQSREQRDLILKLHTGQGKTLLGLLMLQSKINEGAGPALYLCPNKLLVEQTIEQARQFGISCLPADDDLPEPFLEGSSILVAVVHKLFNGLTKFRLGANSLSVGSVLLDDAHACIDAIKDQFVITIRRDKPAESTVYQELLSLFAEELEMQGRGTFADIRGKKPDAYLPVPYWDWWEKTSEVAGILSKNASTTAIKFAWPLVRDSLQHTLCLIAGDHLTITPYLPPLELFGSYSRAKHRIFMSATVTDDSFLVKGLGLSRNTVMNPLVDPEETWSGEKMVIFPSLIDEKLTREEVVAFLGPERQKRGFGVVALVPSAKRSADWKQYGARVVDKTTISAALEELRAGNYAKSLVVANYYDGIDLPDQTCRILVIDSKPFAEELSERYLEDRRFGSRQIRARIARIVEQGMGRAVRGEKDYCVVVLLGSDLRRVLQAPGQRDFFSDQTRTQIELGKAMAEFAREEIEEGKTPMQAFLALIEQCLKRDPSWKDWYVEQMDSMDTSGESTREELISVFELERKAELECQGGNYRGAADLVQQLVDSSELEAEDRGWYLQELARYLYPLSKTKSSDVQRAAHKANHSLLRPKEGMIFVPVGTLSPERRIRKIREWIQVHELFENVWTRIDDILSNLRFGVQAERFEQALKDLSEALGFDSDRPDRDWKEGPDNLWGIRDGEFLLFECKSEVKPTRKYIQRDETDQINRSAAWFENNYPGQKVTRILVIPTPRLDQGAALTHDVLVMREAELDSLRRRVRSFFEEFRAVDLGDIPDSKVESCLQVHRLTANDLGSTLGTRPVFRKRQ